MKKYAVIVAGGSGMRMGAELPKQFLHLADKPVLMHTLEAFNKYDRSVELILCLPASQIDFWKQLVDECRFNVSHEVVEGGPTRYHSVALGLYRVRDNESLVAIHDGVRPFVSPEVIEATYASANANGCGVASVELKDSIRKLTRDGNESVERKDFHLVQTPQAFQTKLLKSAFELGYRESFTDDASVYEAAGGKVFLVKGDYRNIKITTPEDMFIAESLVKR